MTLGASVGAATYVVARHCTVALFLYCTLGRSPQVRGACLFDFLLHDSGLPVPTRCRNLGVRGTQPPICRESTDFEFCIFGDSLFQRELCQMADAFYG